MAIKMIVTDLDGTLMMPDHLTVSERNKNALKACHDRGVKTVISTGRTLSVVRNVIEQIPFIDFVIFSDGAGVYDVQKDCMAFSHLIDYNKTCEIITFLNQFEIFYNIYLGEKIYTQIGKQRHFFVKGLPDRFMQYYVENTTVCENLLEEIKGRSAEMIVAFSIKSNDEGKILDFLSSDALNLNITTAMKDEIEVTDKNASKGKALKELCGKYLINADEIMSFGDSANDSTMLENIKYSFAMENGDDVCKQKASFITLSNKDDGVAAAIEKYALIAER